MEGCLESCDTQLDDARKLKSAKPCDETVGEADSKKCKSFATLSWTRDLGRS